MFFKTKQHKAFLQLNITGHGNLSCSRFKAQFPSSLQLILILLGPLISKGYYLKF